MFIFIVFYQKYHLAARTVLQKRNILVYKIYIFERCACSGYYVTKELQLYFADDNTVHYLSISPTSPPPSFIVSRANNSFSFCHCDVTAILCRLFVPDSIYKKCMIPTTSPFSVRENHMIHFHSLCSVKVFLYVKTLFRGLR